MSADQSKPAVPKEGGVFKTIIPIRWGDMDAFGHVNNCVYFRYVEEARAQCFDVENIFVPNHRSPVLVHASLDFSNPVRYPASVRVALTLTRVGNASLTFDVLVESLEASRVAYAKGKNIVVVTDQLTGKSSPLQPQELAQLARFFV